MGKTFGEKFDEAIAERQRHEPTFGLRTLARILAKDDPHQTEIIRRRLMKYRPRPGGGAAEVRPTEPSRHDIEKAMGLERDSLRPDEDVVARAVAAALLSDDMFSDLFARSIDTVLEQRGLQLVTKC